MTPAEFYQQMLSIRTKEETDRDTEDTHWEADELMCNLLTQLGYGDGVEEFRNMRKWYA